VFSPGIWLIGFKMNRSSSDVQILQMIRMAWGRRGSWAVDFHPEV